jgi:hypothetical protein
MVLPEDLRSELLTSYGRGELTNYHRHLLIRGMAIEPTKRKVHGTHSS